MSLLAPCALAQEHGLGASDESSKQGSFVVPTLQKDTPLLRGQVSTFKNRSPLLSGSTQQIPSGTKVDLVVPDGMVINSEISQKGDEVLVRIGKDIMDGDRVVIPGGWFMRGLVTDAQSQKRGGRNGFVEVQFDKLVSPDGDYQVDFNAKFSTRDKKLKSVLKVVGTDMGYVTIGAGAGALLSIQLTGIPTAIATHGYSVAVGAGIGGTIGLIGALKRKGKVSSIFSGDELKLVTDEPIMLPGFDKTLLPSAQVPQHLEGLDLRVKDFKFAKPWWDDKSARILEVSLEVNNNTKQTFHFFDLLVVNDNEQRFSPLPGFKFDKVTPGNSGAGKVSFTVGSPKRKYFLIFLSRRTGKELSRAAIN